MKVLVTGASGYVGSRLVPILLQQGHEVRTTTSRSGAAEPWWSDRVESLPMDIAEEGQVRGACAGVDAVYYLVHAMDGDDFAAKDRAGARNMARAVDEHGVRRVVYLSGIVPQVPADELSEHISSRLEVEQILSGSTATVITLRAAIVLGSGSTSFEIIRQVSERMPVRTVPDWMDATVQPIAVVDVLAALLGALTVDSPTRHYDVGGPDRLPYPELLDAYSRAAGLSRPEITVPLLPTDLVGTLVGSLTEVPAPVVSALVESLHHDMVCADEQFRADLLQPGYRLLPVEQAVRRALAGADPNHADDPSLLDPMGPLPQDPAWADGGDPRPSLAKAVDVAMSLLPDPRRGGR